MLGGAHAQNDTTSVSQKVKKKRLRRAAAGAAPTTPTKTAQGEVAPLPKTPPANQTQKPGAKPSAPKGTSRDPKNPWGTKPQQGAAGTATDDGAKPSAPWQELWHLRDCDFTQPTTTTKKLAALLGERETQGTSQPIAFTVQVTSIDDLDHIKRLAQGYEGISLLAVRPINEDDLLEDGEEAKLLPGRMQGRDALKIRKVGLTPLGKSHLPLP